MFLVSCCLFLFSYSNSQNLVPNPGFEIDTNCHSPLITCAFPWNSPTNGTPDLYNSCSNPFSLSQAGVPSNIFGFQNAHTGNGYLGTGLYSFSGPPSAPYYIEYLQIELVSNLIANQTYCADFYISLANTSKYTIKKIGMFFSNTQVSQPTYNGKLQFSPQIIDSIYVTDTLNWIHFSGGFIATGGERYLIIGNFNDSIHSDTLSVRPGIGDIAYYYIDDVDVHLYNPAIDSCCVCNGNNGIKEQEYENWQWALLPNPNNGEFRVSTKNKAHNIQIEITDVLGQLIYTTQQKETNTINITLNQPPGLYFVTLLADNKRQVIKLMKE